MQSTNEDSTLLQLFNLAKATQATYRNQSQETHVDMEETKGDSSLPARINDRWKRPAASLQTGTYCIYHKTRSHSTEECRNKKFRAEPAGDRAVSVSTNTNAGSAATQTSSSAKTIVCYKCGVVGHTSNMCTKSSTGQSIASDGRKFKIMNITPDANKFLNEQGGELKSNDMQASNADNDEGFANDVHDINLDEIFAENSHHDDGNADSVMSGINLLKKKKAGTLKAAENERNDGLIYAPVHA
jgi:Tfp pilus assembly protein PilV